MGRRWRRGRTTTTGRARGSPAYESIASPPADIVRRPLDTDPVRAAPGGRLADGLVIDASIVARLLGLRLLTVDARLRFVPAHFTTTAPPPSPVRPPDGSPAPPGGLDDAVGLLADASRTLDRVHEDLRVSLSSRD